MISSSTRLLLDSAACLKNLNPYEADYLLPELLEKAEAVPSDDFSAVAEFADSIIRMFLESPWKRAEKEMLSEFSRYLSEATRESSSSEETNPDIEQNVETPHSVALALPRSFTALEWFRLLDKAAVPDRLRNSVDAVSRRNQALPTVPAAIFEILFQVDEEQTFNWQNNYLADNYGSLDQDMVRDILLSWRRRRRIPQASLNWLFKWCGNEDLRQQWPAVAEEADTVLRRQLIERWLPALAESRSPRLRQLYSAGHRKTGGNEVLRQWLEDAIQYLGDGVSAFVKLSRYNGNREEVYSAGGAEESSSKWRREALFQELKRVERVFLPIILFADVLLKAPDGGYSFALSLLGFPRPELEAWRERLLRGTTAMVHKTILEDLKAARSPLRTIKLYSLGDSQLFRYLNTQLDLVTRNFGNIEQRDKVVEQLALHFSSLREAHLLPRELTKRYRRLMLMIHDDSLARFLTREQLERTSEFTVRRDLVTAASTARRYIQRRRAVHTSAEEMLASRFEFEKNIRRRRLQFASRILAEY